MSISRIELQGQISRANDYTTIKHNEDSKAMVDQSNFQNQFNKSINDKLHQVRHGDNADYENKRFDAKDKGDNQYAGDGGRQRKKHSDKDDSGEKVILKGIGSFDMKIEESSWYGSNRNSSAHHRSDRFDTGVCTACRQTKGRRDLSED